MKSNPFALAAAALAMVASDSAFALACGDVVYQSVTLSGDVACGPDEYGLIVGASGVRIHLNGFKISGSPASIGYTAGIMSLNNSATEIVGPGRILDFTDAIVFRDGGKHRVSGVTALGGTVNLINVGDSVVERSELSHLAIGTAFGGKAFYNRVEDNDFYPALSPHPLQLPIPTIQLAGCGTEKNVVTGNRMAPPPPKLAPGYALMVWVNANNNQITRNTFTRSVLLGHGAKSNELSQNVITATEQSPFAGVEIQSGNVSCMGNVWAGASNNVIRENEINYGTYGVALRSLPGAFSSNNEIRGNVIYRPQNAGLAFSIGSNNNNGTQNRVYHPIYAIDYGTGNLWP